MFLKKIMIIAALSSLMVGCVTTRGSGENSGFISGPKYSSSYLVVQQQAAVSTVPKLDVIVLVFDPNIPDDLEDAKKNNVWPEVRRAESNRFAYQMKLALEKTGKFGAVRVTPNKDATGDLYVIGKIEQSTGEEVEIEIEVYDISERRWLKKSFDHTVPEGFYDDIRSKNKEAYAPLFAEAAGYVASQLKEHEAVDLEKLRLLTDVRFGASFSEEAFAQYLTREKKSSFGFWGNSGNVVLTGLPSEDDPMFARVKALRVKDQLFVDRMQTQYEDFGLRMQESYRVWQEGSNNEIKAKRAASHKAIGQAILGALLVVGAAAAATNSSNNSYYGGYNPAMVSAAVVAGAGGVMMFSKSIQTKEEAKLHQNALEELGQSLNIDLAPQVVEFEESTATLTGDADAQFNQWRQFLRKMYEAESVPIVPL